jgi:ATP/maltotriose-dependent transcriptional regulator MalT
LKLFQQHLRHRRMDTPVKIKGEMHRFADSLAQRKQPPDDAIDLRIGVNDPQLLADSEF